MEITDSNLQTLSGYLQQTLSAEQNTRKEAEKFLESVEANQNYPLLLLQLMDKGNTEVHIRVSAAITFKNYVKRNWRINDDSGNKIHEADRKAIKEHIVGLMLKSPEQIQKQLSDAISIIGREDFPDKWPDLIREMVNKFSDDFHVINGILRTAHSLFKRYRHEFKSQELWTEIKFVLDNFADAFTNLFNATMELAKTHSSDPAALKVIFSSIVLICKIFYSLNFQDLPEHFEDNMGTWMQHFLTLLSADNKILQTQDEQEAGMLEQVKSQICDNVALYAQKYDEEFSPHLPAFVTAIWHLLITTDEKVKYDLLVSNAIQFLASVAERTAYKKLFEDANTLSNICEKVIVPNMQFRAADEELFQDNPEEYIRRDIEGSDIDTRRRAACDLVHALCKSFEGPVIQNFTQYVQGLLQEYAKSPGQKWKSKDSAIYLVTSLAAKAQTQKHGVTQSSTLVNIQDFYQTQILPDLQAPNVNEVPVLKADAIKYLMVFRNQLPREVLAASLPHLVHHMAAISPVVHSYAAHALERLLMVRTQQGGPAIAAVDLQPISADLIRNLVAAMNHEGSAENEYIMKAIMRTMSTLQEQIVPLVPDILKFLTEKLHAVSKNPSKPHFNHYLFESFCILIRASCKSNPAIVSAFEEHLFKPFTDILQQDVQEFAPYVFQILSLLIELHQTTVPETYMTLFAHLLTPVLWERPGNIPALVRLLQAYIERGSSQIQEQNLNGLLGVFQKLIASKSNDHEGFYLMNTIVEHMSEQLINKYMKQVFVLLFQRLQSSRTTKYVRGLLVFFCIYAIKYGAVKLIGIIDSIQPQMFGMVIQKLFVLDIQKVSGHTERKICAVGITKLLTEPSGILQSYEQYWSLLLDCLIKLFELPEDESVPDDEHFIEIEDTPGYQTAFSQLAFAGKKENDIVGGSVQDPKINLVQCLGKLSVGSPGKLMPLISTGVPTESQNYLQQYLKSAGITLV